MVSSSALQGVPVVRQLFDVEDRVESGAARGKQGAILHEAVLPAQVLYDEDVPLAAS